MSYQHIENLYRNQDILLFKECYVSEKIHGTSAHIRWQDNQIHFFSGGECNQKFSNLFNISELKEKFQALNINTFVIYGEAYGGKQQGMRETYGDDLKFIVFEVKIGDCWLDMYSADKFASGLGFEFVWYTRCSIDIKTLDTYRDQISVQAKRNSPVLFSLAKSEGIVIRPIIEVTKNNGQRIIAKHKRADFSETKTPREVNKADLKVLSQIKDICIEWVTENRLSNILSHIEQSPDVKYGGELDIKMIPELINLMVNDVLREGEGEIVKSKLLIKAISRETALMVKRRLNTNIKEKLWKTSKNV